MLNGWKAIAAYLGREERTAMRWAAQRGLPVHRAPGRGRGSVYALPDEIDGWLAGDRARAAEKRMAPPAVPPGGDGTAGRAGWRRGWLAPVGLLLAGVLLLAAGLVTRYGAAGAAAVPDRGFTDAAAKASYLQATYDWNLRTRDSLAAAVREYGDAIARDPRVAAPYVGLANSYLLLREYGSLPDAEAYGRAEAAAKAALDIAPGSAAAHRALAFVAFWWRNDRATAWRQFAQAIALAPNDPLSHHWFATALSADGQQAAALREIGRARDLDPTAASIIVDQGLIAYLAGDRPQGVALLRRMAARDPASAAAHRDLAYVALWEGRPGEYLAEAATAARLRGDGIAATALRRLDPLAGNIGALHAEMLRQARAAAARGGGWFELARVASLAGRHDLAGAALTRACSGHEPDTIGARGDLWLSRTIDAAQIAASCGGASLA